MAKGKKWQSQEEQYVIGGKKLNEIKYSSKNKKSKKEENINGWTN